MEATLADAMLLAGKSNANNDYYLQVSNHLVWSLLNLSEMYYRNALIFFVPFVSSRSFTLKAKHRLQVLANKMLRKNVWRRLNK
jgi:hypothetical protein